MGYNLFMKILKAFLKYSAIALLVFVILIGISSLLMRSRSNEKMPTIGSYKPLNVLGGSMEPAIKLGSVIIIKKVESRDIKVGDIVTYKPPDNLGQNKKETLVTHRVIKIDEKKAAVRFKTKGDANKTADAGYINERQIVGRLVVKIPYMGKIGFYAKTPLGFLFLIIAPGLGIIIMETINIIKRIKGLKNEKVV